MQSRWAVALVAAFTLMANAAGISSAQSPSPQDDPSTVYRFDPFLNQLIVAPAGEIKPGFLYYRHHAGLKRRVWSLATPGGGFEFAMAIGSVQPARALDLRATPEELRRELVARAPELAKIMDVRGGIAYVRLIDDQSWELVRQPTIASVYDLATLRRWEWHGTRRVAVVHTGGYDWLLVNGQFVPASYGPYSPVTGTECW